MRSTLIHQNLPSTISPISTRSIRNELAQAQAEIASGRWHDVGYKLADQTGMVLNVRTQLALIDTFENTNALATTRADFAQNAVTHLVSEAQVFFDASIVAHDGQLSRVMVENSAREGMAAVIASVNTTVNGVFLFSGLNTDTAPLEDYFGTPPPASKNAVDAAFFAEFGFAQSDPAVTGITPAAMENFIDNAFSALFDPPGWAADWSSASDETMQTRVSFTEFTQTSQTANESAIRKLTMAYTMVADLGIGGQNDAAFEMVMDKVVDLTGQAIGELNVLRGKVGVSQQRIEIVNEKLVVQKDIFDRLLGSKENINDYEVATRVSVLTNQLEASYTLTARLQQLSLVKFL